MTYYNGNPYNFDAGHVWEFAHDDCLPPDQFDTHVFRDGTEHKHQKLPWRWSPVWGHAEPCKYCPEMVK